MRRGIVRVVMAVAGICSLAVYVVAAALVYVLFRVVWFHRPSAVGVLIGFIAFTLTLGYVTYRLGTGQVLSAMRVTPVQRERAPRFYRRLDWLCDRMDLPQPRVYVAALGEPNAFAMNSPHGGIVVFDRSLVSLLTPEELDGVLAHELAHLEGHDTLRQVLAFTGLQTVVQVLFLVLLPGLLVVTGIAKAHAWIRGRPTDWSGTLAWRVRSLIITTALVLPVLFAFVLLARSRRREFAADARAVEITGDPLALARAIEKIDEAARANLYLRNLLRDPDAPATTSALGRLLATHPSVDARVERLRRLEMGRQHPR